MKNLTYPEQVKLVKIILQMTHDKRGEESNKLHIEAIKIVHGNADEVEQWYKENSDINIMNLNKVIDELNTYIEFQLEAKNKILSAGSKLISDFSAAEVDAKQAIRLASGNPQKYDKYESEVNDYFKSMTAKNINTQKKSGQKVDHPKDILEKQQFIKDAKNIVNTIANSLMVISPEFRENRVEYIKHTLENSKYKSTFLNRDGQLQYRTIRPDGDYGKPEVAFKEGLAPQFVSVWAFQEGVISRPYINDVFETSGEKVGWSGGITSTSANLKFCAAFDFAASYGIQDGLIYIYACGEAASIARHISFGVGYDGKVDRGMNIERSNAEAAMEYMVPYLSPDRIIGAREVKKDGSLGNFIPNPHARQSAFGDTEFLKLILCNNVDEIKLIEFMERRSAEVMHNDHFPEYVNKMTELFSALPPERQLLIMKIAHTSQIALNQQLTDNLDPNLKNTDPVKWSMLHQLNFSKDPECPFEVLPNSIKSQLSNSQCTQLESLLKNEPKVVVKSHFGFEFERDKRSSADPKSNEKIYLPTPRFFQSSVPEPISHDDLEKISKETP